MQQVSDLEFVVIGGAYKSGTSLLCESVELLGFSNPCDLTNPAEQGHGIHVPIYNTRECSVARSWNRELVITAAYEKNRIETNIAGYLQEMRQAIGPRIVIKDPYMKLTSYHWFRAARKLGATKLVYLQIDRDLVAVRKSWDNSQFMTRQQRQFPDVFARLVSPIDDKLLKEFLSLGVNYIGVKYGFHYIGLLRSYFGRLGFGTHRP